MDMTAIPSIWSLAQAKVFQGLIWVLFFVFCLALVYSSLIVMCLGVVFFVFILIEIHGVSWACGFIVFIRFGKWFFFPNTHVLPTFFFLGPNPQCMEVPRLAGLNWSCSCWPTPQSQQHGIQAKSATYAAAHGNPGSLTHWARPGIKPTSSWMLVGFVMAELQWKLPQPSLLFFWDSNYTYVRPIVQQVTKVLLMLFFLFVLQFCLKVH